MNTVASRIAKNEKALHEYGVEIYDENNELKSTYDILSELAPRWETMSKAEQVALGTTLAGVNQYKVFSAVMTNFNTAIKATNDALGSNGSALQENEKYMESIEARLQSLKAELQKFILAENSLQQVAKVVLGDLTNIVKVLNTFGGKLTVVSILLIATIDTLISKISVLKNFAIFNSLKEVVKIITTSLIPAFQQFGIQALFSADAVNVLNASLQALNINPYMLAITAVIAALAAGIYIIHQYNHALDEQKDKFEETKSSLENYESKLSGYEDSLKNTSSQLENYIKELDRLNNLQRELTESEQEHKDNIERKIKSLESEQIATENLIRLEEKLREEQQTRVNQEGYTTLTTHRNWGSSEESNAVDFLADRGYITNEQAYGNKNRDTVETLKLYSSALIEVTKRYEEVKASRDSFETDEDYQNALAEINQDYLDVAEATSKMADEVYNVRDAVSEGSAAWNYATEGIEAYENAIGQSTDVLTDDIDSIRSEFGDLDNDTEDLEDEFESLRKEFNATEDEINKAQSLLSELELKENELSKQIGMSSIELIRQAENWRTNGQTLYDYLTKLNQLNESLDNIQSNYQTLKSAVDEYNETKSFSVDTLQTLLKLSPEYLQTIFDENGELRLQNGILELNEQAIKDKISMMAAEAKQDIYNNAVNRILNLTTDENTEKNIINKQSYDDSTEALKKNSDALVENARATLANTVAGARKGGVRDSYINQILKETEEQIKLVDKMVEGLGTDFSKAMGNSSNSTKGTNSALKEQNNLLKEQKQLLEDKKKQYDSVISYIKKKIQGEIDKLKDEKKAQVDAIKDQIDALKDLKDAESDAIDEQIDKLKEQKEIEEEYWSEKIEAFKKQNEELEEQLEYEELLENLAKAKSKRVRVYKEGQGFVYTDDSNEVDKAQAKIDEYTRKKEYNDQLELLESYKESAKKNYEQQIDDLEKLKKEKEKNYDEQIKALEQQQKAVEDSYDAQIAYYQAYLDKFTEETDAYENQQNRLLALQLTGIDFEAQGWQTRLDNLANFVEKYNALLGDIHTLEVNGDTGTVTVGSGSGGTGGGGNGTTTNTTSQSTADKLKANSEKYKINNLNLGQQIANKNYKDTTQYKAYTDTASKNKKTTSSAGIPSYVPRASGDAFTDDGMYLVGENPNQELIIGSKLNGSLVNLSRGSGVVNSTSTNTLAGILNQLGAMSQNGINMSNSQTRNTNISIGNISLPNVSNGKDFVDYLQDFSLQMTQTAFA